MLPANPLARLRGAALAAALLLGILPATSRAQGDADMQTLAAFRLTESGLGKMEQATRNLAVALKDPAARAQAEQLADAEDDDSPSLAQIAARYDQLPFARSAITSAGMSTREFVTFQFSLLQASMAAAVMEMQPGTTPPKGTPPENVAFVRTHRARLEKFGEEMKALAPEPKDEGEGEEAEEPAESEPASAPMTGSR